MFLVNENDLFTWSTRLLVYFLNTSLSWGSFILNHTIPKVEDNIFSQYFLSPRSALVFLD